MKLPELLRSFLSLTREGDDSLAAGRPLLAVLAGPAPVSAAALVFVMEKHHVA
jgi:hypothetical protein